MNFARRRQLPRSTVYKGLTVKVLSGGYLSWYTLVLHWTYLKTRCPCALLLTKLALHLPMVVCEISQAVAFLFLYAFGRVTMCAECVARPD